MATPIGPADPHIALSAVGEQLRDNPCEFQFFQAVWLLERLGRGLEPVGRFASPEREIARFGVNDALSFPASQIQRIEWPEGGQPRMVVNFMGLTGPSGVLPIYYSELVNNRLREKDRALAEFLEIFNHRSISLFYQAWEKYHFPAAYQRGTGDLVSRMLSSLVGIGTPGLESRQNVPDDSFRFYTGLLSLQPSSASALRDVLMDYFDVPVEIDQFVGAWYELDAGDQCCMDTGTTTSEQLGVGVVVGDAIWDRQARIRVRLGPMSRERYHDFLPSGAAHKPLESMIRFFVNDLLGFEVQIVLERDDVPRCQLGGEEGVATPLGWLTWMNSGGTFDRNPGDTILVF